ncbi:MAG: alanyl-tRNA editing protein [Nanoarchaeota archaeon]|nr:alanyl-tRNA editing protein [Nanoarchaeota archaeon]
MTQKIFWENPYQDTCTAKITSIEGKKIKIDRTVFFACSGGQESDEGTIAGIKVVNAVKLGDKESIIDIEYELEIEPILKIGDDVSVHIDIEKRKKLMRLHSAAHIAYYFMLEKLGKFKIIGSNIGQDKARVDFLYDTPVTDVLPEIEAKLNSFLSENQHIIMAPDPAKPDLRWWCCGEWKMPCGGTHVKNTGEIRTIELKRKNIGAGKERVEIYLK